MTGMSAYLTDTTKSALSALSKRPWCAITGLALAASVAGVTWALHHRDNDTSATQPDDMLTDHAESPESCGSCKGSVADDADRDEGDTRAEAGTQSEDAETRARSARLQWRSEWARQATHLQKKPRSGVSYAYFPLSTAEKPIPKLDEVDTILIANRRSALMTASKDYSEQVTRQITNLQDCILLDWAKIADQADQVASEIREAERSASGVSCALRRSEQALPKAALGVGRLIAEDVSTSLSARLEALGVGTQAATQERIERLLESPSAKEYIAELEEQEALRLLRKH